MAILLRGGRQESADHSALNIEHEDIIHQNFDHSQTTLHFLRVGMVAITEIARMLGVN
jgi:hypothetical protein